MENTLLQMFSAMPVSAAWESSQTSSTVKYSAVRMEARIFSKSIAFFQISRPVSRSPRLPTKADG